MHPVLRVHVGRAIRLAPAGTVMHTFGFPCRLLLANNTTTSVALLLLLLRPATGMRCCRRPSMWAPRSIRGARSTRQCLQRRWRFGTRTLTTRTPCPTPTSTSATHGSQRFTTCRQRILNATLLDPSTFQANKNQDVLFVVGS